MKAIDLTHIINPQTPVFPGTEPPIFEQANTVEMHGFAEKRITMFTHTGTHMDSPSHMIKDGKCLDKYELNYFIGKAVLLDFSNHKSEVISITDLLKYEDSLSGTEYVVIRTGWSKYWGQENYFQDFPTLTIEAAKFLTEIESLKGVAVDAISFDRMKAKDFPIHHIFLGKGLVLIENLANLHLLTENSFIFTCMPLKIEGADGSSVRAAALLDL
jgi:arylformamidase